MSAEPNILTAAAREAIQEGQRIILVLEAYADDIHAAGRRLYATPTSGNSYHGVALNDAAPDEAVRVERRVIQLEMPQPFRDALPNPREFTPEIIQTNSGTYGLFLLELSRCAYCNRPMMQKSNVFPVGIDMNQDAQTKRAGIVYEGRDIPGEAYRVACEVCVAEGKLDFKCVLCRETRTSDLLHDDPHDEPVCKVCYTTKTAAEWDAAMDAIDERHQWDYS